VPEVNPHAIAEPVAPTTQTLNFLLIKPKFENNKMNALYLLSK
jgi:hypothetical protein